MALTNNITYCGKYSFDFFSPAIYSNELFDLVGVLDGIKSTMTIPLLTEGNVTVSDSCDWSDAATVQLDGRVLAPCTFQYRKEFCISDIESTFLGERLRDGARAPVGPDDFINYVMDKASELIAQDMQTHFWSGTAGCTGIFTILGGAGQTTFASGVVGVTAASGVTAGNVFTELGKIYAAIPSKVKDSKTTALFVTRDVMDAYKLYLAQYGNSGLSSIDNTKDMFLGIPMYVIKTSNTRRMVAADAKKNLWIGTDMLGDMNEVNAVDLRNTTNEDKLRLKARWRFGTQVGILAEVVYYA